MKIPHPRREPTRHPSFKTLAAYAAGELQSGFGFVVAVHLSSCRACREDVRRIEAGYGQLLGNLTPVAMSTNALEAVRARLAQPAIVTPPPPSPYDLLQHARKRYVAPGIWVGHIDTPRGSDNRVFLLGGPAGKNIARHGHNGIEFMQVLIGALREEDVVYRPGDFGEQQGPEIHDPIVTDDEPCICLFATQGKLKPEGFLARIAFTLANV